MTFKYLTISALVITTVVSSVAQSTSGLAFAKPFLEQGRLEGNVSNENGEPIEYVTVLLRQPHDSVLVAGAVTDAAGRYSFESVAPGKYILTLTFVGYHKQSILIEQQDGAGIYTAPDVIL